MARSMSWAPSPILNTVIYKIHRDTMRTLRLYNIYRDTMRTLRLFTHDLSKFYIIARKSLLNQGHYMKVHSNNF